MKKWDFRKSGILGVTVVLLGILGLGLCWPVLAYGSVEVVEIDQDYPRDIFVKKGDIIFQVYDNINFESPKAFERILKEMIQKEKWFWWCTAWVIRDNEIHLVLLDITQMLSANYGGISLGKSSVKYDKIPFALWGKAGRSGGLPFFCMRIKRLSVDSNFKGLVKVGDYLWMYNEKELRIEGGNVMKVFKEALKQAQGKNTVPIVLIRKFAEYEYVLITLEAPPPIVDEEGNLTLGFDIDTRDTMQNWIDIDSVLLSKGHFRLGEPINPTTFLKRAEDLKADGKFEEASELYKTISRVWPLSSESKKAKELLTDLSKSQAAAMLKLAAEYQNTGAFEQARGVLLKIIRNWPGSSDSEQAKKMLKSLQEAQAVVLENQKKQEMQTLLDRASDFLEAGELVEAVGQAKKALELNPESAEAKEMLKSLQEAQAAVLESQKKQEMQTLLARASDFLETGNLTEAVGQAKKALELNPESAEAQEILATAEAGIAAKERAEAAKKAKELRAKTQAMLEVAKKLFDKGDFEGALSKVQEAQKADPLLPGANDFIDKIMHTGVQIRASGTVGLEFSGYYGNPQGSTSLDGSVPKTIFFREKGKLSVVFQKKQKGGTLIVEIVQEGKVLVTRKTDAEYGAVTLTVEIQ